MHPTEHSEYEAQIDAYLLGRLDAEETERFEKHYFDCPECFRLTAERAALIDAVKAAGPAPARAAEMKSRRLFGGAFNRFPFGWAAGGAAVVLLAAAVVLILPRSAKPPVFPDSGSRTVRGAELVILAPVGVLPDTPKEFTWKPFDGAAGYTIIVEGIEPSWTAETRETSLKIPEEIAGRMSPGHLYAWRVKAYSTEGTLLAASPKTPFSIAR